MSETKPKVCPKCGGEMVEGGISVSMEQTRSPDLGQYTPGFMNQGLPPGIETYATAPVWEERTGEKKGFIIKRPEVKKMRVVGHRCSLCNLIEFYARP